MVLFGGLEIVAAGYLIHKHNQNKREKALLREELALAEEELAEPRPHRHHHSSQSLDREESKEERRERHRRRRSRERREQEKWEAEHNGSWQGRPSRDHSAPPKMHTPIPVPVVQQPVRPVQTQTQQPGFPPTGWPAHWKQSQTPPTPPPPQVQPQNPNGYPPEIKYGFVPEIPHEQYPPYPPPPFSPGPGGPSQSGRDARGRASTLDVNESRGRRHRRSASPMIGVVDEYERSPVRQQVRFSNEDVVLGGSGRGRNSPPPSYSSRA